MTGAQKCSHVHGMACEFGRGANVWVRMAAKAVFEYSRGDCSAIWGNRRGSEAVCMVVGLSLGCSSSHGTGGAVGVSIGVSMGVLVTLCQVWR